MKPEEMNRKAAEACGWQQSPTDSNSWKAPGSKWYAHCERSDHAYPTLPDYCHDHNALKPLLQAVINDSREYEFEAALKEITSDDCGLFTILMNEPTPIVEACLRALGLWVEDGNEE